MLQNILICFNILIIYASAQSIKTARIEFFCELNSTYPDTVKNISGFYGIESPILDRHGELIHVLTYDGKNHGCDTISNAPKIEKWVALIQRGNCTFDTKISNAITANASAVIVYGDKNGTKHLAMHHSPVSHVVTLYIVKDDGDKLAQLVDKGLTVNVRIAVDKVYTDVSALLSDEADDKSNFMLILSLTFVGILFLVIIVLCLYFFNRWKFTRKRNRAQQVITMEELMQARQNLMPSSETNNSI